MPKRYDDDRSQKSWRDIDKAKDGSAHRSPDRPKMNPNKQARADSASKVYKSKLDAFFDGEASAPAHVKEQLSQIEESSSEGKARIKALKAIKSAKTSAALDKSFAAYLKKWEMPPDFDILSQALNCGEESYIETALNMLEEMFNENRIPKHIQLLEQRLRRVKTLADDPDLQDQAAKLTKTLRLFSKK